MSGFEDLSVWQEAMRLALEVYKHFDQSRDFGFRDQICRSAVSVPSNITEGSERGSAKEFIRFLRIALGSAAELRTQLYLAQRLQKCPPEACATMIEQTRKISAQLAKLVRHREANSIK